MPGVDLGRVVGSRIASVEAHGKHLVMTFAADGTDGRDLALRTHMLMTGSWHVYERGARWHRPRHQARLVIEAGDRLAVCFNVPVAVLDHHHAVIGSAALTGLGPDVLVPTVGEALLDQHVLAGLGNVYRCEALFLEGLDPWTPPGVLGPDRLGHLVTRAVALIARSAWTPFARDTGAGPGLAWVHQRTGRPCRRCGTTIRSALLGEPPRRAYWCPTCQPPSSPAGPSGPPSGDR
jgi:endonuclease-8